MDNEIEMEYGKTISKDADTNPRYSAAEVIKSILLTEEKTHKSLSKVALALGVDVEMQNESPKLDTMRDAVEYIDDISDRILQMVNTISKFIG